jgi:hypothetical protein
VKKVPIGGGPVVYLVEPPGTGGAGASDAGPEQLAIAAPSGIQVDTSFVYWTNTGDGNVRKIPVGGPTSLVIASHPNSAPKAITLDQSNVYWAEQGNGSIWVVAK